MSDSKDLEHTDAFYTQLFSKAWKTIAVIIVVGIIDLWLLPIFREMGIARFLILLFALIKIYFLVRFSFDQLVKIIGNSHLLSHILVLFALLIGLIIFSFAIDFWALHNLGSISFKTDLNEGSSAIEIIFEYLYFSTITFSSVGYGDIVPMNAYSKTLVMLEVALRFFVLVFGIANINRIHVNNK
tara:strand:+ start:1103 stop:1657 length:555 start_codon:yes stop_codon:yes gene_type:complete